MIYELLYTSVPKGLKPGAKGYCTVLTTEGIPSALLERLESYCGYRHLFDPGSPDNPVAYGHRVLNLAGNTWHILSRVADAGTDYSGRSNLIGHFMAISQDELKGISAGPTSLMMSPGLFRKELVGEPRRVSEAETSKRLVGVMDRPQKAVTWNMVAGDAGWAGKLVQTTEESSESVSLVYPLRTNTLKLLDEAVSTLPKNKQWDITFNTFFTKSGEECRWRCYCANVPEAVPFKGSEFDLVDVKRKGLDPGDGVYVGAAREGKKIAGGVAKTGPAIARNPLSGPRRSLIKEARAVQQAEEREKDDWVEELGIETPKGKVSDSIRLASSKTAVPPEIGKTNRITFDEMYEDSQELRSLPKYKKQDKLLVMGLVGIIGVMMIMIAMTVLIPMISKSIRRNELVVSNEIRTNPSVIKDVQSAIPDNKHIVDAPKKDSSKPIEKIESFVTDTKSRQDSDPVKPLEPSDEAIKSNQSLPKSNTELDKDMSEEKIIIAKRECDILFDGTIVVPLEKYLLDAIVDKDKIDLITTNGILIELPDSIELKGKPDMYYKFSPEKRIRIKDPVVVNKNTLKLAIPAEINPSNIYDLCMTTIKIGNNDIQLIKPVYLVSKKIPLINASLGFRFSVKDYKSDKTKFDKLVKYQKKEYSPIEGDMSRVPIINSYVVDSKEYFIYNPETKVEKIKEINKAQNGGGIDSVVDILTPKILVSLPKSQISDHLNIFEIKKYDLFCPLTYNFTSELKKLRHPKSRNDRLIKNTDNFWFENLQVEENINDNKVIRTVEEIYAKNWSKQKENSKFCEELLVKLKISYKDQSDAKSIAGSVVDSMVKSYQNIGLSVQDGLKLGPPRFLVKMTPNTADKAEGKENTLLDKKEYEKNTITIFVYDPIK